MIENTIAISVAPLNRLTGRRYDDLSNTVTIMQQLLTARVVDGFEFQNLAEWDARTLPRDEGERRFSAWETSEKHTVAQLAATLADGNLPVLSIHANRDVGTCLCSEQPADGARGRELIHESLWLAQAVDAGICVFHLWDTWKETFDPAVDILVRRWHYTGPLTIETYGAHESTWEDLIAAMRSLVKRKA